MHYDAGETWLRVPEMLVSTEKVKSQTDAICERLYATRGPVVNLLKRRKSLIGADREEQEMTWRASREKLMQWLGRSEFHAHVALQDDSSKVPANQVRFCQAEDILLSEEQEGLKLKRVSSSSADAPNQRFKIFKETDEFAYTLRPWGCALSPASFVGNFACISL